MGPEIASKCVPGGFEVSSRRLPTVFPKDPPAGEDRRALFGDLRLLQNEVLGDADVNDPDNEYIQLDTCDAVRDDSFTRVGRKGDDTESIPGLLDTGRWRQLKGGITTDSGCSIDTVPTGHAPNVAMGPVPANRANRRINAANGTRIRESTELSSSSSALVNVESKIGTCLSLM